MSIQEGGIGFGLSGGGGSRGPAVVRGDLVAHGDVVNGTTYGDGTTDYLTLTLDKSSGYSLVSHNTTLAIPNVPPSNRLGYVIAFVSAGTEVFWGLGIQSGDFAILYATVDRGPEVQFQVGPIFGGDVAVGINSEVTRTASHPSLRVNIYEANN